MLAWGVLKRLMKRKVDLHPRLTLTRLRWLLRPLLLLLLLLLLLVPYGR